MSWIWFVLGFLAFPAVGFGLMWGVHRASRVTPTAIATRADLQEILRALLAAGNDEETLFLVWFPMHFEVRVTKRSRESRPATLDVEIRSSGRNSDFYAAARASLETEDLEFAEDSTPARQQPRRLRLTWPDGGPFVVSAVAHVIAVLESALPASPELRCAAACEPPDLWRETVIHVA